MAITTFHTSAELIRPEEHFSVAHFSSEQPCVDIVLPVYNEELDLEPSVRRLHAYLLAEFPFTFRISIADNGSTDGTWALAQQLAVDLAQVRAVRIGCKGRGRALRHVWSSSDADVLVYMDIDLSTDLAALMPLVAPLLSGHSDVAIGSRLARSARVLRGPKRELISRCYNGLLAVALGSRFSDAQCGFKAVRADVAHVLLPLVRDEEWFFDTEMLVLAERAGLRIYEVPVDWVDDPDSRVDVVRTALADLKGMVRLAGGLFTGAIALDRLHEFGHARARTRTGTVTQLGRFLVVGVVSTLAYVCLYLLLRASLAAQAANAVALFTTAVANTWGNRRFTFAVRGSRHALRHQVRGLAVFAAAWGLTAGSLAAVGALGRGAGRLLELIALVVANLTATVLRFVALRGWVFRSASRTDPATVAAGTAARQAAPEVLTTGSSS